MDAQTVGEGYGRWLVFHKGAREGKKNAGKMARKLFSAAA
jgi:hypothetical protein